MRKRDIWLTVVASEKEDEATASSSHKVHNLT